jgi:hypothetical protein
VLLRPGIARGHRSTPTDDRVRSERARLEPLQVHRATSTTAVALRETEDLGERALKHGLDLGRDEVCWIDDATRYVRDGLGQELVVAAV